MSGERSGLFMEQIRITKEMREQDVRVNGRSADMVRPRFLVWENVGGAFSSSSKGCPKGADFQAVLTEISKVVCKNCPDVPIPQKGWPKFGCIYGVGDNGVPFSIAWKLTDSQWWGVPQRRKRIALLADFNGLTAGDILFDPQCGGEATDTESDQAVTVVGDEPLGSVQHISESVRWNPAESGEAGQGTPCGTEESLNPASTVGVDVYNQEISGDTATTVTAAVGGSNTSGPKVLQHGE